MERPVKVLGALNSVAEIEAVSSDAVRLPVGSETLDTIYVVTGYRRFHNCRNGA